MQELNWIVDELKKLIITALCYLKVKQGKGFFKLQNVSCPSLPSKRFSFDHYWIPIILTIMHYWNELLINSKWNWWFHFVNQWFYRCSFMKFQCCEFSKRYYFYFYFWQTLATCTLTMQNYYNELLMNNYLKIKMEISLILLKG